MARLSQLVLERVQEFLLEIHRASDVEVLRQLIPRAASRLIESDRANFNEFNFVEREEGRFIVPSPVPTYWTRLGSVIVHHAEDHALFRAAAVQHRGVTFSDRRHDRTWTRSTLFNEYYRPIGVQHQLATHLDQDGCLRFSLGFNRQARDFSSDERALLELISPHVACAWRNARELSALRARCGRVASDGIPAETRHLVAVDLSSSQIVHLSLSAALMLRRVFGKEAQPGDALPDRLNRWLKHELARSSSLNELGTLPQELRLPGAKFATCARLVSRDRDSAIIVFCEEPNSADRSRPVNPAPSSLTAREKEILFWVNEGKRNAEIAIILGVSARTVGKHLEHIFVKLGVETRTAAVRAGLGTAR